MPWHQLYVAVEGSDDKRFFEELLEPLYVKPDCTVRLVEYACMKRTRREALVRSIRAMQDSALLVLGDMDDEPCFAASKAHIQDAWNWQLVDEEILVVKREVESWYLAVVDANACTDLRIKHPGCTDDVTKEELERLRPAQVGSLLDFKLALLEQGSVETGRKQNASLAYLLERHRHRP